MDIAQKKCNSGIILTGPVRSGTTITGQIIGSMRGVEYLFDPGLVLGLFSLIKKIPKISWMFLYENYLFDTFLLDALAGRNLNHNRNDSSWVLNTKDNATVRKRLAETWHRQELEKKAESATVFYKLVSAAPYVPHVQKYYPKIKIVVLLRNPNDIFHSIKQKKWFSDSSLKSTKSVSPSWLHKGYHVPAFVPKKDWDTFIALDEIGRMGYYYILMHRPIRKIRNAVFVKYEDLIANPLAEATKLASALGLSFGPKTKLAIAAVHKSEVREGRKNLLNSLPPEMQKKVATIHASFYYYS